jgi:4-oxalocrotonate tautomerase
MPHISVKMHPGRTEQQKTQLTERIVKDVMSVLNCDEKVVSVTIEEVKPADWAQKVYKPDILENRDKLYKQPGYNPFE